VPERDEDDLGIVFPGKPSELRTFPDEELFREVRRLGYANLWPQSSMAQYEMQARLILATKSFKKAAERSSLILSVLTCVLVVLTIVLVVYTVRAA
jgi:hypothetical protein